MDNIGNATQESLLAAIVSSSDDAIVSKDVDDVILTWNHGAEKLYGYTEKEAVGQPIALIVPPHLLDEERETHERVLGGERIRHYVTERIAKDGRRLHVSLAISPLRDSDGNTVGVSVVSRDLTAQMHDEARFRGLLEAAPDAVVIVDGTGRIELVNRQTEHLFGYTRDELLGQPVEILVPESFRGRHRGHRTGYFAEPGLRPMGAGLDLLGRRRDGSEFPVEISLSPIETPGGLVVSAAIRDVTQRRREDERFRALLESAPDAMVIVDHEGRIVLINRQVEHLFGYERDDLLGQPVEVLVPDRFRARHRGHRTGYFSGPVMRPMGADLDLFGLRSDDTEFPVEISLSPIVTDTGTLVAAAIRDVTERKLVEEHLQHALDREREVADQLREVDALKDEFLSIVSHELRTPLASISGFSELLVEGSRTMDGAKVDLLVDRIFQNATEMGRMIEQLLDYSRLQAGKVKVEIGPLVVRELIATAVEALRSTLDGRRLAVAVPPELQVMADQLAFARVITNLLTNAVKFSPEGSLIEIAAEARDGVVVVSVRDEGVGVPPEDIEQIFERFYQSPQSRGVKRGTGIGLSIARRYVELQGGRIWAEARSPGTAFFFTLPRVAA